MAKSKLVRANEKIAEGAVIGCRKIEKGVVEGYRKIEKGAVEGYRKIEKGAVEGYKKIEEGAVGGFNKIADKFVDNFLTKEGESVEEAKARLAAEQKAREEKRAESGRKAGLK
ncbi:MAG: hypothetical protein K2O06_08495 [Acetatifactor sp.]|nr:hypothetical protein [Acetatifactor sp.]